LLGIFGSGIKVLYRVVGKGCRRPRSRQRSRLAQGAEKTKGCSGEGGIPFSSNSLWSKYLL
jgi:hypothetical protein